MIASETEARSFVREQCGVEAVERFERLEALLREENRHQNLVSAASLDEVWTRHFADSVQLLCHVPRETGGLWLDLGTGAGFPGLAIALASTGFSVVMVESRRRRCDWLRAAADKLLLANTQVVHSRLEVVDSFPASVISARAFAPMPKLLNLSARFSTADTYWVLPKGRSARQELDTLPNRAAKLFHVEQSLTDRDAGIIVGRGFPEGRL